MQNLLRSLGLASLLALFAWAQMACACMPMQHDCMATDMAAHSTMAHGKADDHNPAHPADECPACHARASMVLDPQAGAHVLSTHAPIAVAVLNRPVAFPARMENRVMKQSPSRHTRLSLSSPVSMKIRLIC